MRAADDSRTRCPLTVVGGFLGAGKTTFLNRVLSEAGGRYAVLVNDFGAVNIDAALIAGHDGETLRLTNGCVCCSLGDSFLDTLMRVLDQEGTFDHILIEASGVGDPAAIADIALVEPGLELRATIVLADAERIASLVVDERVGDTVAGQIRAADIVILNKVDLVDPQGLARARAALRGVREDVRILETVAAEVPEDLLDLGASRSQPSRFKAEAVRHEAMFERIAYRRLARFDAGRLPDALSRLPASLLRLKGALSLAGSDGPRLLQMVGPRWTLAALPRGMHSDWPIELVGIGAGPGLDAIERILDDAIGDEGAAAPPPQTPNGAREENATCR